MPDTPDVIEGPKYRRNDVKAPAGHKVCQIIGDFARLHLVTDDYVHILMFKDGVNGHIPVQLTHILETDFTTYFDAEKNGG